MLSGVFWMNEESRERRETALPRPGSRRNNRPRWRHEYKYVIDAMQEGILTVKAGGVLTRDPHVREDGTYLIRSLYFDDIHDSCLAENLSGSDPRSKFRIRYYNDDTGRISLEKKSKKRGMCLKESCRLTADECRMLMNGRIPVITEDMPDRKKSLLTEVQLRGLVPKTIVTYERIPFIYSAGNVRVTFDRKITSSKNTDRFLSGDYVQRPILQKGHSILEVKWDEVMPKHINETLHLNGLEWTAFSKYYMCRKFHL